MRRIIFILLCVFILCGCASSENENISSINSIETSPSIDGLVNPRVLSEGDNYKLLIDDNFDFYYYIYDSNGEVVLEEMSSRPVDINILEDSIIDIAIDYGTATVRHQYYSIEQEILSDIYWDVITFSEGLVAYINVNKDNSLDNRSIIIQNIFDKNLYYKEISLDFSREVWPIVSSEFSSDNTMLNLIYLKGDKAIETSDVIILD